MSWCSTLSMLNKVYTWIVHVSVVASSFDVAYSERHNMLCGFLCVCPVRTVVSSYLEPNTITAFTKQRRYRRFHIIHEHIIWVGSTSNMPHVVPFPFVCFRIHCLQRLIPFKSLRSHDRGLGYIVELWYIVGRFGYVFTVLDFIRSGCSTILDNFFDFWSRFLKCLV